MGRRAKQRRQERLWIAHTELPRTVAHPFYEQLNRLLEERGFDEFVEQQCGRFYAERMGRPSLAYKAEHAVDLETGAVVAVTVAAGDAGDPETILETLPQAGEHIAQVACATNNEGVGKRVEAEGPRKRSPTRDITATTRCRRWRKRKCERISQNRIVDGVGGETS
ncbi:MAG: hypothetical protein ABR881_27410 [Candidatus Sulfotelmatobacter sp.]